MRLILSLLIVSADAVAARKGLNASAPPVRSSGKSPKTSAIAIPNLGARAEDPGPDKQDPNGLPNLDLIDPEVMFAKDRPCFNYGAFYCEQEGSVRVFDPKGDSNLQKELIAVQAAQLRLNLLEGANQREEAELNERILKLLNEQNPNSQCRPDCAEFLDPRETKAFDPLPHDPTFNPEPLIPVFPVFQKPAEVEPPQCEADMTEDEYKVYVDDRWNLDAINHERKWDFATQSWVYADNDNDPLLDQVIDKECVCCGLKPTIVFVLDTGIQPHDEFGPRLLTSDSREFVSTTNADGVQAVGDTHGHGTHVAGTVGGCTVGVNQCTLLVGYRVFPTQSGSTSRSRIIRAINKVTSERGAAHFQNHDMTINLSLGGSVHSDYDTAVNAAVNAGITVVIAAGNSNGDACNQGPANVGSAITVGSTTRSNSLSWFTNYGSCVDIQAPGSDVYSAAKLSAVTPIYSYTESDQYDTMSGTSMAAPAVAGMASLVQAYREKLNVDFQDPAEVWEYIKCVAREDFITGMGSGTTKGPPNPNLFLQRYLISNWRYFCRRKWWWGPYLVEGKDLDDYTPLQLKHLEEEASSAKRDEASCRRHRDNCSSCQQTDGCELFIIDGKRECHNEEYLIAKAQAAFEAGHIDEDELRSILRVDQCDDGRGRI